MPSKNKKGRRGKKKQRLKKQILLSAGALFLLATTLGAAFYFVFLRVGPRAPQEIPVSPGRQAGQRERPAPRVYSPSRGKSRPTPQLPQVAIVIDDMGIHKETGAQLLALNLDLTFSFLPYAPHTRTLARIAERRGRDVLLHLPMEPDDTKRWDPGLGALYLAMPAATLRMRFEKDLSTVPMAIGVNNHMGSKFTTDRKAMRTVLSLFRPRGLFFLDSVTTSASVGYQVAREIGVPARRRDVFLDNVQERAAVERQIDTLIRVARKNGSAVAIGHPHPATVAALTAYLKRLHTKVRVVGLHQLMR